MSRVGGVQSSQRDSWPEGIASGLGSGLGVGGGGGEGVFCGF